MTTAEAAANITAWAVQMLAVVAAAALAQALLPIDRPRARLAYWQAVLALVLVLPLLQPWIRRTGPPSRPRSGELAPALVAEASTAPAAVRAAMPVAAPPPREFAAPLDLAALFLWTLAAGAVGSLARLGLGLYALRRVRRHSRALPPEVVDPPVTSVELRLSRDLSSPVTFGLRAPVVVLPAVFETLDADEKRSVVCHELVHVERRDWVAQVAEELLRALLWFHPALHWLIGRVRLAREQAVDAEVVRRLGRRTAYLEALVRLAAGPRGAALLAASPMLGRSTLSERVDLLLKEKPMPKRRVFLSFASSVAVVALAAAGAAVIAPLRSTVYADDQARPTLPPVAAAPAVAPAPAAPAVAPVPAVPAAPAARAAAARDREERRSDERSVERQQDRLAHEREALAESRRALEEARRELQAELRRLREEMARLRESGAFRELGDEARRAGLDAARLSAEVGAEASQQAREIAEQVRREMERMRAEIQREVEIEIRESGTRARAEERAMEGARRNAEQQRRAAERNARQQAQQAQQAGRQAERQAQQQAQQHAQAAQRQADKQLREGMEKAQEQLREAEEQTREPMRRDEEKLHEAETAHPELSK